MAALACAGLLASGCLGTGNDPKTDGSMAPPPPDVPLLPMSFMGTWQGDLALMVTVEAETTTTCSLDFGYQSSGTVAGWEAAFLELRVETRSWMIVSQGVEDLNAHVGGEDVGAMVTPLEGGWLDSSWTLEDVAAPTSLLVGVRGLVPGDGANLVVQFDCAGPATLTRLEAGQDLAIWDGGGNGHGVGAGLLVAGLAEVGANAADGVRLETTKPHSVVFAQEGYGQAGTLALAYPGGSHDMVLQPHFVDDAAWFVADGGPGVLSADFSEIRFVAGGHWGILAGLGPIAGLGDLAGLGDGHDCLSVC